MLLQRKSPGALSSIPGDFLYLSFGSFIVAAFCAVVKTYLSEALPPFGGREGDCFWYNGATILAHMIAVDGAFLGILEAGGSG